MAERYSRVFTLDSNLYSKGNPVIVSAGALLLDTQTNSIIAQLKFRSISEKEIKAIAVKLFPRDTAGRSLGEPVSYSYLDLKLNCDDEFGSKVPIRLPDNATREITVEVSEVVFDDNTIWTGNGDALQQIPKQTELSSIFKSCACNEFKKDFGSSAKYVHLEHKDLMLCVCGAVNHSSQSKCHICKADFNTLASLDYKEYDNQKVYEDAVRASKSEVCANVSKALKTFEGISNWKDCSEEIAFCNFEIERLEKIAEEKRLKEEKEAKELRIKNELVAKKIKRNKTIVGIAIAVIVAFIIVLNTVIIPMQKKNDFIATYGQDVYDKFGLVVAGEYIKFGAYEQDNNTSNGKEDVEWFVLEVKDGKALVISKYALDCKQYNTSDKGVTWENCTLRKWLNNDFLGAAFSADEKAMIPTVMVSADKNPEYSTTPGNATQDQVFLLSISEANKYFSSNNAGQCMPTDYAVANGAWEIDSGNCRWWLRSPGYHQNRAAYVYFEGGVNVYGNDVYYADFAVRPTMWIDINGGAQDD